VVRGTVDIISKVEHIRNGSVLGIATTAPYTVTVNNLPQGTYDITAKVTGSFGGTLPHAVLLPVANNMTPSVTLTTNPATAVAPASITLPRRPAISLTGSTTRASRLSN
jgi:chitinase